MDPSERLSRHLSVLHHHGCNDTLPLSGENLDDDERNLWVRQDRDDRWSFHSAPLKFEGDDNVFQIQFRADGVPRVLHIRLTSEEMKEMAIQDGDDYHIVCEVKKPGAGVHPVPFVRLCDIGPWSNWHYANKVAFKIIWKSQKDGKLKTKYLQRSARFRFVDNCTAPGALEDYSIGVGLYCFFVRCRFPLAQPWSADFGRAKIVDLTIDDSQQHTRVTHVETAQDNLSGKGPHFSADVPRVQMERLGLQNVDGSWMGFDWGWLKDKSLWKDGKVLSAKLCRVFKLRKKCDFCFLAARSAFAETDAQTHDCERVDGFDICLPCNKMGRPCSWTGLPYLVGQEDWLEQTKDKRFATRGGIHIAAVRGLLNQTYASDALKVFEIDGDGSAPTVPQQSQLPVHWNDLTTSEQANFISWDNRVRAEMNSMAGLEIGTPEYQGHMDVLQDLVSSVDTSDMSDKLRGYIARIKERDLLPFIINGRVFIRGG